MFRFQRSAAGLLLCILAACSSPETDATEPDAKTYQAITLELDWTLSGLESPESVIPDATGAYLYVSNVNGQGGAKDANGYIAQVSLEGAIIEKKWADGLNAPKGMALVGDTLFVSDIDQLVLIDAASGAITSRIDIPDAVFLNDVAASKDGILISDSAGARIYQYADGQVSVWLADERLGGVNGLLAEEDRLLITTMSKGELLSADWRTKTLSVVAGGMENADGLTVLGDGSYLVSSWPGMLYHVSTAGDLTVLLDTKSEPVYLNDFYRINDRLFIPNWQPGSVRSYLIN
jgi:hypothetical protein